MINVHRLCFFLISLLLVLLPCPVWAAVALHDAAATSAHDTGSDDNTTLSYTVTAGACLLVVDACNRNTTAVSGVTFGAAALTSYGTKTQSTVATSTIYYLVNPTASTATITVTWAASNFTKRIAARTYEGCDTSTPFGTVQTAGATSSSATLTATVTDSKANDLIIDAICAQSLITFTPGSGTPVQTERYDVNGTGSGDLAIAGSDGPGATGSQTMDQTPSASVTMAMVAGNINVAAPQRRGAPMFLSWVQRKHETFFIPFFILSALGY